jgi:sigma-B regulation protein RsbU (phosphoserine phosphatase)
MTNVKYTQAPSCFQEEKITASNAQRLAKEYVHSLSKIRAIQQQFIPQQPIILNNYTISSFYRPAYYVSGDLCLYVALGTGKVGILVVDVIGKGLDASVMSICLKYMFQSILKKYHSPKEVMTALNMALCTHVTLGSNSGCGFYGVLDTENSILTYCNCGIGVSKLFRTNTVTELRHYGGFILGAVSDSFYTEGTVQLKPDDVIVIATDGLEDVKNRSGKRLGTAWLSRFMMTGRKNNEAGCLSSQIKRALYSETDNRPFLDDDIACVCIQNKTDQ